MEVCSQPQTLATLLPVPTGQEAEWAQKNYVCVETPYLEGLMYIASASMRIKGGRKKIFTFF
jgi:hypothetical protein